MKMFLIIPFLVSVLFASGGDTLKYSTSVNDLSDGDVFYAEQHWKSLKDSIRSIINGRLGNKNLAADAKISLSKLDTTGTITADGGFKGIADSASGSSRLGGTLTKAGLEDSLSKKAPRCSVAVNTLVKSTHATSGKQGASNISDDGSTIKLGVKSYIGTRPVHDYFTLALSNLATQYYYTAGGAMTYNMNAYFDGASYRYSSSSGASQILQNTDGLIIFRTAPAGTASGVLTWSNVACMANGKMGINTITPDSLLAVFGGISATGGARIDGPLSSATINTGYGATEVPLYTPPTTFQCSLYDDVTYKASVTATYSVHGNVVSVYIPTLATTMSSGYAYIKGLPEAIKSNTSKIFVPSLSIFDGGSVKIGGLRIFPVGDASISRLLDGAFNSGVCGISETSFCYALF